MEYSDGIVVEIKREGREDEDAYYRSRGYCEFCLHPRPIKTLNYLPSTSSRCAYIPYTSTATRPCIFIVLDQSPVQLPPNC